MFLRMTTESTKGVAGPDSITFVDLTVRAASVCATCCSFAARR